MKKSQLKEIIREEIYRLMPTAIDDKVEILRKALLRYQIDLNELPKEVVSGALDAMDSYKDVQTIINTVDNTEFQYSR